MVRRQSAGVISFDAARGPGDPGIVDEHVEPAQCSLHIGEKPLHICLGRHIRSGCTDPGVGQPELRQERLGHVADVHPGPVGDEHVANGAADARCPCRDQDAQARRDREGLGSAAG